MVRLGFIAGLAFASGVMGIIDLIGGAIYIVGSRKALKVANRVY
jgi:hypothetical protein